MPARLNNSFSFSTSSKLMEGKLFMKKELNSDVPVVSKTFLIRVIPCAR